MVATFRVHVVDVVVLVVIQVQLAHFLLCWLLLLLMFNAMLYQMGPSVSWSVGLYLNDVVPVTVVVPLLS